MNAAADPSGGRGRGRPPLCPPGVRKRVVELRRQGLSLSATSDRLNSERLPTPAGKPVWTKSHVDRLLHTGHVRKLIAQLEDDGRASE
ncbi:MAG: recombinase family protein [Actinoallomurus sp.]